MGWPSLRRPSSPFKFFSLSGDAVQRGHRPLDRQLLVRRYDLNRPSRLEPGRGHSVGIALWMRSLRWPSQRETCRSIAPLQRSSSAAGAALITLSQGRTPHGRCGRTCASMSTVPERHGSIVSNAFKAMCSVKSWPRSAAADARLSGRVFANHTARFRQHCEHKGMLTGEVIATIDRYSDKCAIPEGKFDFKSLRAGGIASSVTGMYTAANRRRTTFACRGPT